ncbi:RNA-directed RNA polymerase [ssRNA phage Esthiorhiza.4_15]|uniref:RNA-directed RNA polymerase n=2 Tax=Leviviricetes TaxID=2842243 RepID=A0A8S5KXR2_9VIRU|nr:RNA-directed RNA polymerase [ssRNA phage Esthiorhiza.4_15]QDH87404.1 MAG: RNA-dependent RNA polymerase [Leviviridae sp.]DAD50558.1 TPA_asm: RNA-directed RNA polymerase [ssRNA phage Esthiorhiza.4_15]
MKSLIELWSKVSDELGTLCHVSTTRDIKTVTGRFEHEGVSFLTITLPNFCDDFQKSLAQGSVDHDAFPGFSRMRGLPRFLGGFLDLVFDRDSGRLLDNPSKDSIYAIRQLTLLCGKIGLACSDARNAAALRKYVECEKELKQSDRNTDAELLAQFKSVSLRLFGDVLASADLAVYRGTLTPKHGPGKTADRLSGNAKFDQSEWTRRLEQIFPYGENAIPNWRYNYLLSPVKFLEPGQERPVRIVLVPKTLKTPRIIAIEPTCMQYMQQAVAERLMLDLESDVSSSQIIGFRHQEPNQLMARIGSLSGSLATLDLSEASDRVSNQHVRLMLKHFPHLSEAVDASRSRKADVPGYGVLRLAKFASMGSALCFPIEAMVFATIVVMALESQARRRFTRKELSLLPGRVRVYGDDLIVPADSMVTVTRYLEAFGLKVNRGKSFGTGKFRESCGKEYYDGRDVSIVRVRSLLPASRSETREVISTVSLRNRLYEAGLWKTAFWLDSRIEPLLAGRYPYVGPDSPVLGRVSYVGYDTHRMSPSTHSPQVRGFVVHSQPPPSRVSGEGSLTKWFLKRGDEPFADRDHLMFSGRPKSVTLRLRWARSA